jgi:hypothetical protein
MSIIGADELIFTNDASKGIYGGGFSVKSVMMKNGISPIITLNAPLQNGSGTNVSELFDNLVIPNWAYYLPEKITGGGTNNKNYSEIDSDNDVVDDDLHDKLLDLVKPDIKEMKKAKVSRKNVKKIMNKKTRKHMKNK